MNRIIPALTLLVAFGTTAFAGDGGQWTPRAPMLTARQEPAAVLLDDRVYVFGGLVDSNRATDAAEVYDVATDRWTSIAPIPKPRDHAAAGALAGKIYLIGGFNATFAARDTVYVYDPASNSWADGPDLPEPLGAAWAVSYGDKIYVFGGSNPDHDAVDTTYIFDESTGWTQGAPMPTAREHLTAACVGDFIYAIGGRAVFQGDGLAVNERYDPSNDVWTVLSPMTDPRSAMATAAWDSRIVVAGGESSDLFGVNEIYDTETDTWTRQEPMTWPRHSIAAVTLDEGIFCAAGATEDGVAPTTYVDQFRPGPTLEVSGPCAGEMTFRTVGGTPGAFLVLFYAAARGRARPLAGVELGLDETVQIGLISRADSQGRWEFSVFIPSSLCGALYLQMLDNSTRLPGNVAQL